MDGGKGENFHACARVEKYGARNTWLLGVELFRGLGAIRRYFRKVLDSERIRRA
jgi:hypothetical protein